MPPLQTRQASIAVLNSQEIFRLFQALESSGDIFELDTGSKALCVGPQSDISSYRVDYFDSQAPDNIDELFLAVGNPWVGRLDSLNKTIYPTANLPARLLISSRDLVDNTFLPSTFDATGPGDVVASRPPPAIDIVAFLRDPPAVAPLRDDRQFTFPTFPIGLKGMPPATPQHLFYLLPYYGRRYAYISFQNFNLTAATTYTIEVRGINLNPGKNTTDGSFTAQEKVLGTLVAAQGVFDDLIITAEADGMFDLISIDLTVDVAVLDQDSRMRVLFSDRVS